MFCKSLLESSFAVCLTEINNDVFHNDNYEVHFCWILFVFARF